MSIQRGWSVLIVRYFQKFLLFRYMLSATKSSTEIYRKKVESLVSAKDSNMMTHLHLCLWVDASRSAIKRYARQAFVHFVLCVHVP